MIKLKNPLQFYFTGKNITSFGETVIKHKFFNQLKTVKISSKNNFSERLKN